MSLEADTSPVEVIGGVRFGRNLHRSKTVDIEVLRKSRDGVELLSGSNATEKHGEQNEQNDDMLAHYFSPSREWCVNIDKDPFL